MQPPQMLSLIERLVDAVERMSSELTCLNKTVSSLVVQNHTVGRVAPSSQTRNKKDGFTETETLDLLVMDTAEDPPRGSFTSMPLLTGQFVEEADVLQDSAPVDNVPATSKLRATETNTQNEAERGEWQEHLATASDAEEIQAGTGMVNPLVPVKKENDGIITVEDWQYENSVEEVAGISQGDQTRNIIAREEVTAFNEEQRANSTHAPVLPAMTMHPDPACHNTGSRNQLRGICFTGDATNQMIAEDTNEQWYPEGRGHKCTVCGRVFAVTQQLVAHLRTKHTGERPFQCTLCGKAFALKSVLTTHLRIHAGDRPHACHLCGKTFLMHVHLTNHLRIHTGEKPFACHLCGKRFSCKGNLNTHVVRERIRISRTDSEPL